MELKHIYVYSHREFDELMTKKGLDSSNVGDCYGDAFISITETEGVQEDYLCKRMEHFFDGKSDNVINLEFDDIDEDERPHEYVTFYGITKIQAERLMNFIEENKGRNFYIHCKAGRSRSQGVCRYILDMYGEKYGYDEDLSVRLENPCNTPNMRVVRMLKRAFYKKHGYFE